MRRILVIFLALLTLEAQTPVGSPYNAWDDPTNARGFGKNTLSQRKVYLHQWPGVTIGSGQTLTTRQNTATAIQNAINACATNGWDLVVAPGMYEIDVAAGLTINGGQSGFAILGTRTSQFIQFHSNAPILTVGDTTSSNYSIFVTINGLRLQYGASQASSTSANILIIGALRGSWLNNITLGADGGAYTAPTTPYLFPAYRDVFFSSANTEFSNSFTNFHVQGAQFRLVDMTALGTGSIFSNWYITNGYINQPGQVSDVAWYMNGGNDSVFDQMNLESVATNVLISTQTVRGTVFHSIHLESDQGVGANPTVWQSAFSRLTVDAFNFTGMFYTTATLNTLTATGTASVFTSFGDDAITTHNLYMLAQNAGNTVAMPLRVFTPTLQNGAVPTIEATNIIADDFVSAGLLAQLSLDPNMPLANYKGFSRIGQYNWGPLVSSAYQASRTINSTYTVYGEDNDSNIFIPATVTSFTLTLHTKQAPSGNGSTTPTKTGTLCNVQRLSGTVSGLVTIADSTAGTITTNSTATNLTFRFNGTVWVLTT